MDNWDILTSSENCAFRFNGVSCSHRHNESEECKKESCPLAYAEDDIISKVEDKLLVAKIKIVAAQEEINSAIDIIRKDAYFFDYKKLLQGRYFNEIVIHHSASRKETTVQQISQWHKTRGFNGIGYHFVINKSGVFLGRPLSRKGAHCKGHNTSSIGICVCGNYEIEKPEQETVDILLRLVDELVAANMSILPGMKTLIYAHRDLAHTACPGANLYNNLVDKNILTKPVSGG